MDFSFYNFEMAKIREIPWPRILAEGAAIVVSILLAFSIEAWWADREDRDEEHTILLALRSEFQNNLANIESQLSYRNAVSDSIVRMLRAGAGQITIEADELDGLIGDLLWWGNIDFATGALDSVLQSGNLSKIENEQLRQVLASMPAEYDYQSRLDLQDKESLNNVLMPYLYKNALVPQIANTLGGQPGIGVNPAPSPYPVGEHWDHTELLSSSEFLGILTKLRWDQIDAIWGYSNLAPKLKQAIQLIDEQVSNSI